MGITAWGDEAPRQLRLPAPADAGNPSPLGQLPPPPPRDDTSGALDAVRMRELLGFPWRSVRRHRALVALVFLLTIAAAATAAVFLPRSYHVETRLLAQRNSVMMALGNPRRSVPNDADSPMLLAKEVILSREALSKLIVQTNLLDTWERIRPGIGRIKENLTLKLTGKPAPTRLERIDQLVDVLLKSMYVTTGTEGSDGTVTISIDWYEPVSAMQLINQSEQNFLEQRRNAEIERITESVAILQRHVDSSRAVITQAMQGADTTSQRMILGESGRAALSNMSTPASSERDEVTLALEAKKAVLNDLENNRSRRAAELQSQLSSLRERYGPAHPEVVAIQDQMSALTTDTPQQSALRAEEATLRRRLTELGGSPRTSRPDFSALLAVPNTAMNPGRMYAESRLRMAITDYEDMTDRLKGAMIELETARAAFKYRFTVVSPATMPKEFSKPNLPLLAIGGLVAAIGLALFAAIGVDLTNGRLNEAWQVEMLIGTPVLGRLRRT